MHMCECAFILHQERQSLTASKAILMSPPFLEKAEVQIIMNLVS
jgi:hypothetical protein